MHSFNKLSTMTGSAKLVKSTDKFIDRYLHGVSPNGNLCDYSVKDEYETTWENNDWNEVDFKIDRVKISGGKNGESSSEDYGYLSLHYTFDNKHNKEVALKPKKAWVILNDGRKLEANTFFDTWENIFSKQKKTYGYIHFNFYEMEQLNDIKGIYVEFSGYLMEDNEKKVIHIYEVPLYF